MFNEDEKKYAALNAKFHKELAEIEAEIERLGDRANVLSALLFGAPEEKQELFKSETDNRTEAANTKAEVRAQNVARAQALKEQGYTNTAIARELGLAESTVRNYLKPTADEEPKSIDELILAFLINNPGSTRKEIEAGMSDFAPDVPYQVEKCLKRLKRAELIIREGTTRNATWYPGQGV